MRILVIDDYQPHGESLRELLEARGHEALYAESYSHARGHLEVLRFDLAFLDLDMPSLRGPIVADLLAERFPGLRSVIVSAHAMTDDRRREVGDRPFLRKPVSIEALLECLARVERELVGLAVVPRSVFPIAVYQPLGLPAVYPVFPLEARIRSTRPSPSDPSGLEAGGQ